MSTKLHQVIAVERDVARTTDRRVTKLYQDLAKTALLSGRTRTYKPKDDEGETFPSESQKVQLVGKQALPEIQEELGNLFNLIATRDWGNLSARADVTLEDGTVLIPQAPTTYLLWLEKQLDDLHTVVSKLPVLDPAETWEWDAAKGCYKTAEQVSNKTKKVPRVLVKAEATDKHPAQTEVYQEDVTVGYWSTTNLSGAFPADEVKSMIDRVNEVRAAVKTARSRANEVEVEQSKVGDPLLAYVFQG